LTAFLLPCGIIIAQNEEKGKNNRKIVHDLSRKIREQWKKQVIKRREICKNKTKKKDWGRK